jgi:hypothetical protein
MRPSQNSQGTAGSRWDETVQIFLRAGCGCNTDLGRLQLTIDYYVAIVKKRHRLFQPGDIVILDVTNGDGERWPAYGLSGRGYQVAGLYVQYCKYWRENKHDPRAEFKHAPGLVEIVEVPEGLKGLPPNAPEIRRFVVGLSSEVSRPRVSSNSPASSTSDEDDRPPKKGDR